MGDIGDIEISLLLNDKDLPECDIYISDNRIIGYNNNAHIFGTHFNKCVCSLFNQIVDIVPDSRINFIRDNEKFIKTCIALKVNDPCFHCIQTSNLWEHDYKKNCKHYINSIIDENWGVKYNISRFHRLSGDRFKDAFFPPMEYVDSISLKDLDMRKSLAGVHLICKIKNLSAPKKISNGKYKQTCIVYDDDTHKTIPAVLRDEVADFDRWENITNVELLGEFNLKWKRPLQIYQMKAIENDSSIDQQISYSRDQETPGYTKWRNDVIKRDEVCQCCGLNKHLVAHHIFGYKEHPELAVNVDNGVTLCQFCHDKYHSIYGVKNINPHDLVEFIRKYSSGGF